MITGGGGGDGCYGNIMNVDTTGASSQTASQDSLAYSGTIRFTIKIQIIRL